LAPLLLIVALLIPSVAAARTTVEEDIDYVMSRLKSAADEFGGRSFNRLQEISLTSHLERYRRQLFAFGPQVVTPIKKAMVEASPSFRFEAAVVLLMLNETSPETLAIVRTELRHFDMERREYVVESLFKTGAAHRSLFAEIIAAETRGRRVSRWLSELEPLTDAELRALLSAAEDNDHLPLLSPQIFKQYASRLTPLLLADLADEGRASGAHRLLNFHFSVSEPFIAKELKQNDPARRMRAAVILSDNDKGSAKMTPDLVWGVEHGNEYWRKGSFRSLIALGPKAAKAAEAVRALLHDDSYFNRASALCVLAAIAPGEKQTLAAIEEGFDSWDEQINEAAIWAVGLQGKKGKVFLPRLIQILEKENPSAKNELLLALAKLGPVAAEAKPALLKLYREAKPLPSNREGLQLRRKNDDSYSSENLLRVLYAIDPREPSLQEDFQALLREDKEEESSTQDDVDSRFNANNYFRLRLEGEIAVYQLRDPYSECRDNEKLVKMLQALSIDPYDDEDDILTDLYVKGDETIAAVEPFLRDDDEALREFACALIDVIDPADPKLYREMLDSEYEDVRKYACKKLYDDQAFGPQYKQDVLNGLKNAYADVRFEALRQLPKYGREYLPLLLAALDDEDRKNDCPAILSLRDLGPAAKETAPRVLAFLGETEDLCGEITAKDALENFGLSVIPLLQESAGDSANPTLQERAVEVIDGWEEATRRSIPLLVRLVLEGKEDLCVQAFKPLYTMKPFPPEHAPLLLDILKVDNEGLRALTMEILARTNPPGEDALEAYHRMIRDDNPIVHTYAAALLLLNDRSLKDGRAMLLAELENQDEDVRKAAVKALKLLGPKAEFAVPALIEKFKKGQNENLSDEYVEALAAVGPTIEPQLVILWNSTERRDKGLAGYIWCQLGRDAKLAAPLMIKALDEGGEPAEIAVRVASMLDPATPGLLAALDRNFIDPDKDVDVKMALGMLGEEGMKIILSRKKNAGGRSYHGERLDYYFRNYIECHKDKYLPILLRALDTENRVVQRNAAELMYEIGPSAAPELLTLLKTGNRDQQIGAGMVLEICEDIRESIKPELMSLLDDPDLDLRFFAAMALFQQEDDDAKVIRAIVAVLQNGRQEQKIDVCKLIAQKDLRDDSVDKALLQILRHDDNVVMRRLAGETLFSIHQGVNSWLRHDSEYKIMSDVLINETDEVALKNALACAESLCPAFFPYLLPMLQSADEQVRKRAVLAIGSLPFSRAETLLLDMAKGPDANARRGATLAMGIVRTEKTCAFLFSQLSQTDPGTSADTVWAFSHYPFTILSDPDFLTRLRDPNPAVRLNMLKVFIEKIPHAYAWAIDAPALKNALQQAAQDEDADVRAAAQEALKLIEENPNVNK